MAFLTRAAPRASRTLTTLTNRTTTLAIPRRTLASISPNQPYPLWASAPSPPTSQTQITKKSAIHRHLSSTSSQAQQASDPASSGRSPADELALHLSDLYGEAKDELDIAAESTEMNATYAESDRQAMRECFDAVEAAWEGARTKSPEVFEELRGRGLEERIRELRAAVEQVEAAAIEH